MNLFGSLDIDRRTGWALVAIVVVGAAVGGYVWFTGRDDTSEADRLAEIAAFCVQLTAIDDADVTSLDLDSTDVRVVRDELTAAVDRFDELRRLAPADIEPAANDVATYVGLLATAAVDTPLDRPFQRAVALQSANVEVPGIAQSVVALDRYRTANC